MQGLMGTAQTRTQHPFDGVWTKMAVKPHRAESDMSTFEVEVGIGRHFGGPAVQVQALVDTGAFNSMMPASLLSRLGVTPTERRKYALADNSEVEWEIGMAQMTIDGSEWPCPVIFGPEDQYLLGATTLEIFGFMVDPVAGELVPRIIRARPI